MFAFALQAVALRTFGGCDDSSDLESSDLVLEAVVLAVCGAEAELASVVASATSEYAEHHEQHLQHHHPQTSGVSSSFEECSDELRLADLEEAPLRVSRAPLFRVFLELREASGFCGAQPPLAPQPSGLVLKERISYLINEALSVVGAPLKLVDAGPFSAFVAAALGEDARQNAQQGTSYHSGHELGFILQEDQAFQRTLQSIRHALHKASVHAVAYARGFDVFVRSLRQHALFLSAAPRDSRQLSQRSIASAQAVQGSNRSIAGSSSSSWSSSRANSSMIQASSHEEQSVRSLETLLARFSSEQLVWASVPSEQPIGCTLVDSSRLRAKLLPSPVLCLEVARRCGPKAYERRAGLVLAKLAAQVEALSGEPQSVDEYVRLTRAHCAAEEALPALHEACERLHKLHTLLRAYGCALPESSANCAVLLANLDAQLAQSVSAADRCVTQQQPKFLELLKFEAEQIGEPVARARAELDLEFLAAPTQDPGDAASHLERVALQAAQLVKSAARVRRHQAALRVELLDCEPLCKLVQKLELLRQLWDAAAKWRADAQEWTNADASAVDLTKLETSVRAHAASTSSACISLLNKSEYSKRTKGWCVFSLVKSEKTRVCVCVGLEGRQVR